MPVIMVLSGGLASSGSTAVVCVLRPSGSLLLGSVGDSVAIVRRSGCDAFQADFCFSGPLFSL
jgi:hypothetical protein